jgi:murein DD-endopeptidase MepM/ murein hydrolase activator NlpD
MQNPIIVDFPLRGEWLAPNTPAKRIPSHGTDQLGQTYAFDFIQVDWSKKGMTFYDASPVRYLILGVPLRKCFGWGQEIVAPCAGKIITAEDGVRERQTVHLVRDLAVVLKNSFTFNPAKTGLSSVTGNHVIMECDNGAFALFAHMQNGSVAVTPGQTVARGQLLGRVGHSGNSTAPHLHFQLMDNADPLVAEGLPCAFREYELFHDDQWQPVTGGIPSNRDRIRVNAP